MTVFFSFSWFAKQFDNFLLKVFREIFDLPGNLIVNISLWKSGICCIDNFNLSAVNDYEKCFKIVTRKISFQVFTKFCRWKHQTTSPIGDSMVSKVFDELLLIDKKITIRNLLEKIYGLLRKIIDRADMRLVEQKTVSEQSLSDRYCIFEGWLINL